MKLYCAEGGPREEPGNGANNRDCTHNYNYACARVIGNRTLLALSGKYLTFHCLFLDSFT